MIDETTFRFDMTGRPLNLNMYQQFALRTAKRDMEQNMRLLETALGLNGEAGEVADHLKKVVFQGHTLDPNLLMKELGDIQWYIAVMADALDMPLEEVALENIAKLQRRYPNGFEEKRSINREE